MKWCCCCIDIQCPHHQTEKQRVPELVKRAISRKANTQQEVFYLRIEKEGHLHTTAQWRESTSHQQTLPKYRGKRNICSFLAVSQRFLNVHIWMESRTFVIPAAIVFTKNVKQLHFHIKTRCLESRVCSKGFHCYLTYGSLQNVLA